MSHIPSIRAEWQTMLSFKTQIFIDAKSGETFVNTNPAASNTL